MSFSESAVQGPGPLGKHDDDTSAPDEAYQLLERAGARFGAVDRDPVELFEVPPYQWISEQFLFRHEKDLSWNGNSPLL